MRHTKKRNCSQLALHVVEEPVAHARAGVGGEPRVGGLGHGSEEQLSRKRRRWLVLLFLATRSSLVRHVVEEPAVVHAVVGAERRRGG